MLRAVGVGCVFALIAGCGGDGLTSDRDDVTKVTLRSIAVGPAPPTLFDGALVALTAIGTYSDGSTQDLTATAAWTSSNASVATASAGGAITAVGHGGATITAQSGTVRGSLAIKVSVTMTSVAIAPATLTLPVDATQAVTATASYDNGTTKNVTPSVTWTSNDPTVATVTATGLLITVGPGSTTILATATGASNAPVVAMASVTVTTATIIAIAVSPGTKALAKGLTQAYRATATYGDGSRRTLAPPGLTWSSSAPALAAIDSTGVATALAVGGPVAIVAMPVTGTSGSATLSITPATLVALAASPSAESLAAGTSAQLAATGTYTDGSIEDLTTAVTWSASPAGVVTVSASGLVQALAPGTTTVTAKDPATGKTANVAVTVTPAVLESLALSPPAPIVPAGLTAQLAATGTYSNGSTSDLTASATWDSSAPDVATVTAGLVTAKAPGTATITATDPATAIAQSLTVTVAPAALASIAVAPVDPSVPLDTTAQLTATATYTDGSTADVTRSVWWASSSGEVAVANAPGPAGQVTALIVGSDAIVTATDPSTAIAGATNVIATAAILEQLTISPQPVSLLAGQTQQLVATGTLSDGTSVGYTQAVAWSSSSASAFVASSSNGPTGLIVAQSAGDATITASDPATGMTASVDVAVAVNPNDDAAAEFSPLVNPAGDWAVGWEAAPGAGFTVDTTAVYLAPGAPEWQGCSTTDCTSALREAPGQLALVPPLVDPTACSTARWTAPASGTYEVRASFTGSDGGQVSVDVLLDGAPQFAAEVFGAAPQVFATSVTVNAGDTLDFEVGNDGVATPELDPIAFDAQVATCAQVGLVACGGACIDASSDVANCGACGNACTTDEPGTVPTCSASTCGFACAPGDATCTGATLVLDFTGGAAYVDGAARALADLLTVTRSTGGYAEDSGGAWHYFGPNTLRVTDLGLLVEQTRTNVVHRNRDLTAAIWLKASAQVARDQLGIDAIADSASSFVALADGATVTQAIRDGSRARTITAFVARLAGTGGVEMTIDGVTWTAIPVDTTWQRVAIPSQTLANPTVGFRIDSAGDAIAIDFVQVENSGVFASSPIATADVATSRTPDAIALADPTQTSLAAGTWFCELGELAGTASTSSQEVVNMRVDAGDKLAVELFTDHHLQAVSLVGSSFAAQLESAVTAPADPTSRVAFAYAQDDFAAAFSPNVGGNLATSSPGPVPTGAFTVSIGSNAGQQPLNGTIRRLEWAPARVDNVALAAWAAP